MNSSDYSLGISYAGFVSGVRYCVIASSATVVPHEQGLIRATLAIDAEVVSLAYDAIPGDAASGVTADATHQADRTGQAASPQAKPMADLVYEARLRPCAQTIEVNGRVVPLAPGMTVTVEVKTGQRRVLDYLFSPLIEIASGAGAER